MQPSMLRGAYTDTQGNLLSRVKIQHGGESQRRENVLRMGLVKGDSPVWGGTACITPWWLLKDLFLHSLHNCDLKIQIWQHEKNNAKNVSNNRSLREELGWLIPSEWSFLLLRFTKSNWPGQTWEKCQSCPKRHHQIHVACSLDPVDGAAPSLNGTAAHIQTKKVLFSRK